MPRCFTSGEYPPDWPAISRSIKDDARWACIRCEHGHDPAAGRTLTVHHFDGDKSNCARWNLMALCQACHLSVQARVDPRVALLFDPATWILPYLAGMYEASAHSAPGPLYDLAEWVRRYNFEPFRKGPCRGLCRTWPEWAPRRATAPPSSSPA